MIIGWGEHGGTTTREGDGTFTAERHFWAQVDSGRDRELDIETYKLCPRRGDWHPTERNARCTTVNVTRRSSGNRLFDVVCTYSNRFEKPDEKNPLKRPAKISVRTVRYRIPFLKDVKGKFVRTTAGEPLSGEEREIPGRTIRIQKNLATWPDWMLDYAIAMNADAVRIRGRTFPPRTLRVTDVGIDDEEFENDVRYFSVQLELQYNPLTWQREFFNRGFYELGESIDDDGRRRKRLKRIFLDDNEPPEEPQWLDKEGKWLPDPQPKDIVILKFDDLEEKPFRVLPLT